jgi:LAGLIDADG-like domain
LQLRRICGHTVRLLGIPFGRKSVTNPDVPSFIMESHDPTVWLSFLRGLFDDEAYVSERGVEIGLAVRQMKLYSFVNNPIGSRVLDQVSELLCRLGIQHVRRKGQTYRVGETHAICWFLRIPRREFRKVHDLGLILLPQKRRKLMAAL